MLKLILGYTSMAVLAAGLAVMALEAPLFNQEERIYSISGEYNNELIDHVNSELDKTVNKPILIDINSPGGEIEAEAYIVQAMHKEGTVDTLVTFMAASAAAQTFIAGKTRYIEPKSIVLFHGASAQGLTAPQAKLLLAQYEALPGYEAAAQQMETLVSVLDNLNAGSLRDWDDIIANSNGKLTKEFIKEHFYHNFEKDIFVSGQELIDLGIAQDARTIDYNKYQ